MNGLREELCPNIIKTPANINIIIIGRSHHFFLTFKKSQISTINDLLFAIIKV